MTTVTSIVEGTHAGGFILSEASGKRSRENVTIAAGADLAAGTVLGVQGNGKYYPVDNDSTEGDAAAAAILIGPAYAATVDVEAAVIVRDAEVLGEELVWPATEDATDKAANIVDLAALGIIVR